MTVEYETERQQRVLILLDAGRMMSSTLGRLTKLDHAVKHRVDASYVAIAKATRSAFSDSRTRCARRPAAPVDTGIPPLPRAAAVSR